MPAMGSDHMEEIEQDDNGDGNAKGPQENSTHGRSSYDCRRYAEIGDAWRIDGKADHLLVVEILRPAEGTSCGARKLAGIASSLTLLAMTRGIVRRRVLQLYAHAAEEGWARRLVAVHRLEARTED